ncbi:MAG: hypothetical protein M0Z89_11515 [Nitrospiraceae bacterium]|nr:hypothetical protein [Nitrospiraceae bacterium]
MTIISIIAVLLSLNSVASAMDGWRDKPFGGYCRGSEWGWYGARKTVRTVEDARKTVQEYYSKDEIKIGDIRDRKHVYEVEIRDKKDELIDVIIVDKRSGRIRTIY